MTFHESGLIFSFPPDWGVRKYDDHTFYKGLSGAGLKAMDFIVLPPDEGLWLIEVKNFRPRSSHKGFYPAQIKTTDQLAATVLKKSDDTRRAIQVIHTYYRRKWLFRLLHKRLLPLGPYRSDWVFWNEAHRRLRGDDPPRLLIWLELEERHKNYRTRFFATLEKQLSGRHVVPLMGFAQHNPLPGLRVTVP